MTNLSDFRKNIRTILEQSSKVEKLEESSLSRLLKHMNEHDVGFITAYRSEFPKKANQFRNKALKSFLVKEGFGVTSVDGSYIENFGTEDAVEVKEATYMVVDINDKGNLESVLRSQGEKWGQDSILFVPRGSAKGILWGTREGNEFPEYGQSIEVGTRKLGDEGEFMTKVNGRPFIFESTEIEDLSYASGNMGRMGAATVLKRTLKELDSFNNI